MINVFWEENNLEFSFAPTVLFLLLGGSRQQEKTEFHEDSLEEQIGNLSSANTGENMSGLPPIKQMCT